MTREEALKVATEHVHAIATNARGHQDGVRFPDKVASAEQLARFLMEGAESTTVQVVATGDETILHLSTEHRESLRTLLRRQIDDGPYELDAVATTLLGMLEG